MPLSTPKKLLSPTLKTKVNATPTPLVSVIIPTYNYGHLIQETLDCLVRQTYQNWEAIVVDDGSTDNTKEIIEIFGSKENRIHYFYKENSGLAAARNTGLKAARGDFVQFLDADDLISEQKLELQVAYMINTAGCDISYSQSRYFQHSSPQKYFHHLDLTDRRWMPEVSGNQDTVLKSLILTNLMTVNSALVRQSLIYRHNLKFNTAMRYLEDWDFWIQCALKNATFNFLPDDRALALVRVHQVSMSTNRVQMKTFEIAMRKELDRSLPLSGLTTRKALQRLNIRQIDLRYREVLRETKAFNYKDAKKLFPEIGLLHYIKLKLKDLNHSRKN